MVHAQLGERALGRLDRVIAAWVAAGYRYVPLPWMVPPFFLEHTRPEGVGPDILAPEGGLVASGEQSFLWLDAERRLPQGGPGFIGWTPCFRSEPVYDAHHHRYFMKAEVFVPLLPQELGKDRLERLVREARGHLEALGEVPEGALQAEWLSDGSVDLTLAGVEVGSYGIRRRPRGGQYLYGTALAEPRWGQAAALWSTPNP